MDIEQLCFVLETQRRSETNDILPWRPYMEPIPIVVEALSRPCIDFSQGEAYTFCGLSILLCETERLTCGAKRSGRSRQEAVGQQVMSRFLWFGVDSLQSADSALSAA